MIARLYERLLGGLAAPTRGIVMMASATIVVSVMHVMIRELSAELHAFEIAFFRNLVTLCFMLPMIFSSGPDTWRTKHPKLHIARGLIGAAAVLTWFQSLALTPVATATALSFAAPIFITIAAAIVLKEPVGPRRWTAVGLGFLGAMIILRPGMIALDPGAILVLVSTVFWAASLTIVKLVSRDDSSVTIVFYAALFATPISLIAAWPVWEWPDGWQFTRLMIIGTLATVAHLCMTQAFREADASVVTPIDFGRLIVTTILGWYIFSELPDFWTIIGAVVIFGSTAFITWRESRIARPKIGSGGPPPV
ncbi:MAG: DMT family transporter [Rhodospirillales bacterium]